MLFQFVSGSGGSTAFSAQQGSMIMGHDISGYNKAGQEIASVGYIGYHSLQVEVYEYFG